MKFTVGSVVKGSRRLSNKGIGGCNGSGVGVLMENHGLLLLVTSCSSVLGSCHHMHSHIFCSNTNIVATWNILECWNHIPGWLSSRIPVRDRLTNLDEISGYTLTGLFHVVRIVNLQE